MAPSSLSTCCHDTTLFFRYSWRAPPHEKVKINTKKTKTTRKSRPTKKKHCIIPKCVVFRLSHHTLPPTHHEHHKTTPTKNQHHLTTTPLPTPVSPSTALVPFNEAVAEQTLVRFPAVVVQTTGKVVTCHGLVTILRTHTLDIFDTREPRKTCRSFIQG